MRAAWLLLALLLAGCAGAPRAPLELAGLPRQIELTETPFFPQSAYQCGPAALATVLVHRGRAVTPEALVDQVYLPKRQGSLQVEMVAAARSYDLLVYPLQPRLESLLGAVAAGHPVLVLQNLAFERWPQWHFAVVVGYDLDRAEVILRSGTEMRRTERLGAFARTWEKGGRWAVLAVEPGDVPVEADRLSWLQAASDLEATGRRKAASEAFAAAARRWNDALSWFALGNSRYAEGRLADAEHALRKSLSADPAFLPAWSNLSHVLAERGCEAESQEADRCAEVHSTEGARLQADTVAAGMVPTMCSAVPSCPQD